MMMNTTLNQLRSLRLETMAQALEQQLTQSAKMATLGEMATGLAHEINQPLNVMRMAIANVLKRLGNGDVQLDYLTEKLQRIDAQVQRAARVVMASVSTRPGTNRPSAPASR